MVVGKKGKPSQIGRKFESSDAWMKKDRAITGQLAHKKAKLE